MTLKDKQPRKQDIIAQWAFDTQSILGRFHLWLEDVEVHQFSGEPAPEFTQAISFLNGQMERLMTMSVAVTALGTKLFGRFGEGKDKDKVELNMVKKDADAISAYALSEGLWYATRQLPENHAIMVCLGEGLMPKSGETQEMGSNPQLGFGRIYARPQVAEWLDQRVSRMLNDPGYNWDDFYQDIKSAGITVWGAAIDTLENTSRFARGKNTGPMTVLHLFDQPLLISEPYEGYIGNLLLPLEVVEKAEENSVLLDFSTPRAKVMEAIEKAYPNIRRGHVHVWTLRGKSREPRIGKLWEEWRNLGVHLVEDGWKLPSGMEAFVESGTYAPTYRVGAWRDEADRIHLFICDGYAASAEAMQAASLAPILRIDASLSFFTSRFKFSYDKEQRIMNLDHQSPDFADKLEVITGKSLDEAAVRDYRQMIHEAHRAGLPMCNRVIRAVDFFPEKNWDVLALSGHMCPDPYSGIPGVEEVSENVYKTTVRLASRHGDKRITFTFRLMEKPAVSRLVFNPLLIRFIHGEDFRKRAVKISDSGRIRNELQTLCSGALEHSGRQIRVRFERIPPEVISLENQKVLLEVLQWYKEHHPIWFNWLEIVATDEK